MGDKERAAAEKMGLQKSLSEERESGKSLRERCSSSSSRGISVNKACRDKRYSFRAGRKSSGNYLSA